MSEEKTQTVIVIKPVLQAGKFQEVGTTLNLPEDVAWRLSKCQHPRTMFYGTKEEKAEADVFLGGLASAKKKPGRPAKKAEGAN
jgi:hypothetical protein